MKGSEDFAGVESSPRVYRPSDLIGLSHNFSKTLGESDVYLFAGITGDFDKNHVDREYCLSIGWTERIAHGVLLLGLTSTASSNIFSGLSIDVVSAGYEGVRFLAPVPIGTTLRVAYEIVKADDERGRLYASMRISDYNGQLVLVGQHIQQLIGNDEERQHE